MSVESPSYVNDTSTLLAACFTWSTLYFTLCLVNSKHCYEWHIRCVTFIHAITVTILGGYIVFVQGPWPFTDSGGPNSPLQQFVVTISLAYFLLDLTWCLYFRTEGLVMLLHHTVSIAGLSACLVVRCYGTEMVTTLFGAEITNPLLQLRWFLRTMNKYNTLLGNIIDVAFIFLFGFFRIFLGTIFLYCYYKQETDFIGRFGGTSLYIISWLFWINIVQYSYKKYYRNCSKRKSSDSSSSSNSQQNNTNTASTSICGYTRVDARNTNVKMNGVVKRNIVNGTASKNFGSGHIENR